MNPYALWALAPQASASANFATPARCELNEYIKAHDLERRPAGSDSFSFRFIDLRVHWDGCACCAAPALIFPRRRFSASSLQYLQFSRIKTEV